MTPLICCLCADWHHATQCLLVRSTLAVARGETRALEYRIETTAGMVAVQDAVTAVAQGLWRRRLSVTSSFPPPVRDQARDEHGRWTA